MRLPFIILFLGWLAKQWTLSRGQYPKPSISMIPSHEIFLGEQLSIYCDSPYPNSQQTFQLWHEENQQRWIMNAIAVNRGIFTIPSAQEAHAGKYSCQYCFSSRRCSPWSDHISITITELVYQKPSISVSPSEVVTLGERVTIYCKSEGLQNAEFTLQKRTYFNTYGTMMIKMGEIQFPIVTVDSSGAGIYWCRYCLKSESAFYQRCSNYSDRVSINLTGYWTSKPFIQMMPSEEISPDSNVTIECQGPRNDLTFVLLKSNKATVSKKTGLGKNSTKFHISRVTSEDEGNYTCHYSITNEFIWSVPSDPVELLLTDKSTIPIAIWASIAAGLLLLVLLLFLIAFALHRKRKKSSTFMKNAQPMNTPLEPDTKTEPDEVSYAVLNHNSLRTRQVVDTDNVSESCTYASVAQN
nr:leukocyte immunoglobulin-like receptor subfamily A member 3 isoform X2 [Pogona vitticeps]